MANSSKEAIEIAKEFVGKIPTWNELPYNSWKSITDACASEIDALVNKKLNEQKQEANNSQP